MKKFYRQFGEEDQKKIFIWDNVAFHNSNSPEELIQEKGDIILNLPPYSRFLNPIENMFSKLKNLIRSGEPKTKNLIYALLDESIKLITEDDCQNFFNHSESYFGRCLRGDSISS